MASPYPPPAASVLCSPDLEARKIALVCLVAVAGCGGGERQDEDEPEGEFALDVVSAMFPERQKLAQSSDLVITVRNAGDRAVPNVGVTLTGLDFRATEPGLSNAERPQFAVNGTPREIGGLPEAKEATPRGCDTAYVNTWACGRLAPGAEKTFVWSVTAVRAGPYDIGWRVSAGLDGKARAVEGGGGEAPRGSFSGSVSDEAPDARVADDGKTVVSGTR
jgi:hypothetical protein